MDNYLFLFPHKEYFNQYLKNHPDLLAKPEETMEELRSIIDARYRNKGYVINWLVFNSLQDNKQPDFDSVDERIGMRKEDRILVAGITFEDLTKRCIRSDPNRVLDQLYYTRKLIIGGFHQTDCVDKLALAAFQKGIDVLVDEDTTDRFFSRRAVRIMIPLERRTWSLADFGMTKEHGASPPIVEHFRAARRNKPYLVKV